MLKGVHEAEAQVKPIWYFLYLQNFQHLLHVAQSGSLAHTWSLVVEEHFYFLWPMVVLLLPRQRLMRLCAALVIIAPAWRLLTEYMGWDSIFLGSTDCLGIGAFIALTATGERGLQPLCQPARRLAVVVGPLFLVVGLVWFYYEFYRDALAHGLGTIAAIFFGAMLVLAITGNPVRPLRRTLRWPWLGQVGKYSYAMYVLHPFVLAILRLPVKHQLGSTRFLPSLLFHLGFFVFASLCVFGTAWLSWHVYEKRFLALKRYFPSGRS